MNDPENKFQGTSRQQTRGADKSALEAKPDEARMSEIAKRLLSTPAEPQKKPAEGKGLAGKK